MNISILCPTRKRVENVKRLIESMLQTANDPENIEFVFYVDNDDDETKQFLFNKTKNCNWIIGNRIFFPEMWNRCCSIASSDVVMYCGDDVVFMTKGWDSLILESFNMYEDKIVLVHGKDTIQGGGLATHGFLHKNWIKTLGYCLPPYFSADYTDLWVTEVSSMIGRKVYIPEIYIEHAHHSIGKAVYDETYHQKDLNRIRDGVQEIYSSLVNERINDANKLRKFIENYKKSV